MCIEDSILRLKPHYSDAGKEGIGGVLGSVWNLCYLYWVSWCGYSALMVHMLLLLGRLVLSFCIDASHASLCT